MCREIDVPIPEGVVDLFHRPGTLRAVTPAIRMQGWTDARGITWSTWVVESGTLRGFHDSRFESWGRIFKTIDLRRARAIDTLEGRG